MVTSRPQRCIETESTNLPATGRIIAEENHGGIKFQPKRCEQEVELHCAIVNNIDHQYLLITHTHIFVLVINK